MNRSPPPILASQQAQAILAKFMNLSHGNGGASPPHLPNDVATIEAVVNRLFWASLREEEGRVPRLSVALVPPELTVQPVVFKRHLPFSPRVLARLGPAVEHAGIHLAIWGAASELHVWGIASRLPALTFVVEIVKPGLLVVKYSRSGALGKFGNVAVLEGERFKLADESVSLRPDRPFILERLVRPGPTPVGDDGPGVLIRLALAMRSHGQGGMLLVVPTESQAWRESLVWPSAYNLRPPFTRLAELMRSRSAQRNRPKWASALEKVVADVASLTAVDGAVVMNEDFKVMGFGVLVGRAKDSEPVEHIVVAEPFTGGGTDIVVPTEVGNSRHLAAAQFIHDQREGTALVASQDGPFTVFSYSATDHRVHADRIDGLLL